MVHWLRMAFSRADNQMVHATRNIRRFLSKFGLLVDVTGQKTSHEPRRSGSDRHRRQDEERHRTLQDLKGVITGQGGLEDGPRQEDRQQHSEKYGAHQQDSTLIFDGSGGATKSTTSSDAGPATLVGADAVWAKLLEARDHPPCSSPPCNEVRPPLLVTFYTHVSPA